MKKNTLLIFKFIILIFFIINLSLNLISKNLFLNKNMNAIRIYPKDMKSDKHDLTYRLMNLGEPNIQIFSITLSKDDFNILNNSNYQILINNLNCQAYKVYFNGKCVGSIGDFTEGNSSVKNNFSNYILDRTLIEDTNRLTIETFSLYEIGLGYLPIIICDQYNANSILNWFNLIIDTSNTMSISISLLGFIILFVYCFLNKDKTFYLYFVFAFTFMLFSLPEFITIYRMPFSYITYKKISLLSTYFSVSFISLFLYKLFNNKLNKLTAFFTMSIIIGACILSKDLITFKKFYRVLNVILPLNCFTWSYVCKKHLYKSNIAKIFYCTGYLGLIFFTYQIFNIFRKDLTIINSSLVYSVLLTGSALIIIYCDYAHKKAQIEQANKIHLELYEKSIKDSMTGLYNHSYIKTSMQELDPTYCVAIIDIDNFKSINDKHGHLVGDNAIKYISNKLTSIINNNNIIARYGGDEFFLILNEENLNACIKIMDTLYNSILVSPFTFNNIKIPLTLSSGLYKVEKKEPIDMIISKVDNALYRSKNSGKNKVSIYNSNSQYQ